MAASSDPPRVDLVVPCTWMSSRDESSSLPPHLLAPWREARAAHPDLDLGAQVFADYLSERGASAELPAGLCVADLYLACGCARGEPAALAIFEQELRPGLERSLARLSISADGRAELVQMLRERMLVATSEPPEIVKYDGRGPLAGWLRVCATRMAQRQRERTRHERPLDDAPVERLAANLVDPELVHLKQHYAREFEAAFAAAAAQLPPRARNLLRHQVLDGLSIDQIAAIHHVHRATAARRLLQARAALVAGTRAHLAAQLQIGGTELQSILNLIESQVDLTLRRILAPPGARGC